MAGWNRPGEHSSQRRSSTALNALNALPAGQADTEWFTHTLAPPSEAYVPFTQALHADAVLPVVGWKNPATHASQTPSTVAFGARTSAKPLAQSATVTISHTDARDVPAKRPGGQSVQLVELLVFANCPARQSTQYAGYACSS